MSKEAKITRIIHFVSKPYIFPNFTKSFVQSTSVSDLETLYNSFESTPVVQSFMQEFSDRVMRMDANLIVHVLALLGKVTGDSAFAKSCAFLSNTLFSMVGHLVLLKAHCRFTHKYSVVSIQDRVKQWTFNPF